MQAFVAGFLMDEAGRVALVRKLRPAWQKGKLNAIGGKVEPGETSPEAMRREFREEASLDLEGWDRFAHLIVSYGTVDFFRLLVDSRTMDQIVAGTDEQIEIYDMDSIPTSSLPNLSWLIPMARYNHDRYEVVTVREI